MTGSLEVFKELGLSVLVFPCPIKTGARLLRFCNSFNPARFVIRLILIKVLKMVVKQ